jgi:hypothetical protein
MPFRARKRPQPLDEAALYQYAVGALARQMRTVAELKRLMSRRVEPGEAGESKMAAVVARLPTSTISTIVPLPPPTPACARRTRASASAGCNRS